MHNTLPVIEQITPALSLRQLGELPVLTIVHQKASAMVTLQGAQLIHWQPSGEKPVIWLSEKSSFSAGKAVRGGVPICWPWFGPAGEPAHGFARNLPWSLAAHDENEDSVSLTLMLKSSDQTRALWPHEFVLLAHFHFSERCDIELEARGDITATAALHSYFHVADIDGVEVSGLGNHFIDKVNGGIERVSETGRQTYPDRIDRVYTRPEAQNLITDNVGKRTLEISHRHHSDVVTWNPGAELSGSMSDMADQGYKTMVCVETARVSTPLISTAEHPARLAVSFRIHPT